MDTHLPPELLGRLWIYTNFQCNLRCRYCAAESGPRATRPRLEWPAFHDLVDQAAALGFRQVALTGGEPFLHPAILAMISYASERIDTVVLTNGTLLNAETVRALRAMDRQRLSIQVSLDSAMPAEHDLGRGRGCWRRSVHGLRLLLDRDLRVSVRATQSRRGGAVPAELVSFLTAIGVPRDQVYSMPVARLGRAECGVELAPGDLPVEPTVAADGLYRHPLLIDRSLALAAEPLPLQQALERLLDAIAAESPSPAQKGYR